MPDPLLIQPTAVYTEGQLVRCLGLSASALAKARRDGRLRAARMGARWLYLGAWLLEWLEGQAGREATPRGSRGSLASPEMTEGNRLATVALLIPSGAGGSTALTTPREPRNLQPEWEVQARARNPT